MHWRALGKWLLELVLLYVGWGFLDYAKGFVTAVAGQHPLTLDTTLFGTIGVIAIAAAAVLGTLLVQDARKWFKGRHERAVAPSSPQKSQFQTFFGGDELLKALERADADCAILSANLAKSGQDFGSLKIELGRLWGDLDDLRARYKGIWALSLENKVRIVSDQLREARSALDEGDLEDTRAHVEGAVQNIRVLTVHLKSPPSS